MGEDRVSGRAWLMLVLLGLLYVVSFVDRFVLALLVKPLRAELHLSDLQVGLLFGTFFALFYGLVGVPLARVADRGNRKRLIVAGVILWCGCTIASAFATNYPTLAVLRFGLAIGEAALTPAAFSILTDTFPVQRRMLATTLFSASGMVGASTAFALGAVAITATGSLGATWDVAPWRLTLVAVGLPGLVLAALFALVAREPGYGGARPAPVPLRTVWTFLVKHARLYGGLFGGAGAAQMVSYALIAWSPTLLQRKFDLLPAAAGTRLSIAQFVAAVGGTLLMPLLIRRLAVRRADAAAAVIPVASTLGGVLIAMAMTAATVPAFLVISAAGSFLLIGSTNAVIILIQPIAPPTMRATLTALMLICISSIGLGVGPPLAAVIAQAAGGGPGALGVGVQAVAVLGLVAAAGLFALAVRPLGAALRAMQLPATGTGAPSGAKVEG